MGFVGSPVELEDLEDLMDLRISIEQSLPLCEFSEDASDCPSVNPKGILLLAK